MTSNRTAPRRTMLFARSSALITESVMARKTKAPDQRGKSGQALETNRAKERLAPRFGLERYAMSKAIETLKAAMQRAMAGRPKAGGFPTWPKRFGAPASPAIVGPCPRAKAST